MNPSQATLSKMDPYREGAPEDQKLLLCIKLNLTKNWLLNLTKKWLFVAQTSMKIEEINGKNMDLFFKNYIYNNKNNNIWWQPFGKRALM